ncbi:hypothetical protein LIER_40104 [Lithospermum erythrorhizon]|uniref:Uncharacterized protein n=1 Tax=Lithospermum erythrorhizon TaxID=34254 RepID=A0AAV3QSN7_LITER
MFLYELMSNSSNEKEDNNCIWMSQTDSIVEESETRFGDSLLDLVEVVTQVLSAAPIVIEPNEGNNEEEPAVGDEEHIE